MGGSVGVAGGGGGLVLGLVENMAGLLVGSGGEALAAEFAIPFLGRVAFDPRLAAAADVGVPFVTEHADTPAGRALLEIAQRLGAAPSPLPRSSPPHPASPQCGEEKR